jgi:hypothetical protein
MLPVLVSAAVALLEGGDGRRRKAMMAGGREGFWLERRLIAELIAARPLLRRCA